MGEENPNQAGDVQDPSEPKQVETEQLVAPAPVEVAPQAPEGQRSGDDAPVPGAPDYQTAETSQPEGDDSSDES